MNCNLSDMKVQAVLGRLGQEFSTLDFIEACPYSGGSRDGADCPTVQAEAGRRACCGRRLGEFAREHPRRLHQTNPGRSPARWIDRDKPQVAGAASRPAPPTPSAPVSSSPREAGAGSGQSSLYRHQLAHQIRWKEETAGVIDRGTHDGQPRAFLFPEDRWAHNLLPQFRQDVLDHLARHDIERHQFAHHVMSSQVFALNLAAPFFRHPEWLLPLLGKRVVEVLEVQAEVAGPRNYFSEPGTRGTKRTSADLGVWARLRDGRKVLHLFEVKFTEAGFGECSKGRKQGGACDTDGRGVVRGGGALCPLSGPPHSRPYWELMQRLQVFRKDALERDGACPFRHGGYQLMRNQLLAAAMVADPGCGLDDATFSVLLHDENTEVRRLRISGEGTAPVDEAWLALLSNPVSFGGIRSAREWIEAFRDHPELGEWSHQMLLRYFPGGVKAVADEESSAHRSSGGSIIRPGHLRSVQWMASEDFLELKRVHDLVTGQGAIYYRPTDRGVVMIALDGKAPGYVGFRTSADDEGYLLAPGMPPPDEASVRRRYQAFRSWLATVRRGSAEERAVIPWLQAALRSRLVLPGMGSEWIFLNQEWRFQREDGSGKKSDVLAVHVPSGRLGIIEAKDASAKRGEAAAQAAEYAGYWQRDAGDLAPFFTEVLRVMGRLYGNSWATTATVRTGPATRFFAYPGFLGMKIERLD